MLTLKDLLAVCNPDWIVVEGEEIEVKKYGIPSWMLDCPVQDITGWDDGLTIEVQDNTDADAHIPLFIEKRTKAAILRVFDISVSGGALHIVLDDENVENHHIQWCLETTIPEINNKSDRAVYEKCANLLLAIPLKERRRIVHGYGREYW